MGRFARTFPIAGPRAALCQGWLQYLEGKPDRARRTWEAGLLAARRLGMPYEAAKLHLEIGERFQDPNHLREALEQFEQTKASYDADSTRSSLSNLSRTRAYPNCIRNGHNESDLSAASHESTRTCRT